MIEVFRITGTQFKQELWSGEGGLYVDGRWHFRGRRIIYTSQSLSLAQLEVLVHVSDRRQMPELVCSHASIPDSLPIESIEPGELPSGWRRFSPYSVATQRAGMRWLTEARTAVLKVPSAISEAEWNYLLNPAHPEFTRLDTAEPRPFVMDPRVPGQPP